MGNIEQMSPGLAAKVAAGEVVTRPLNIVKELIENSLDAGASEIHIELRNGGKSLIRVSDNGSGMDEGDLSLCVLSHATSKIHKLEDFLSLSSFGFRGEALPSIAAVSKIKLESKSQSAEHGNFLELHGGAEVKKGLSAKNQGTAVEVRELFYNIPARLKFLKSDSYEKSLVLELVQSFIAVRPEVSFTVTHNGDRVLFSGGNGNLQSALGSIFPKKTSQRMFEIKESTHPILKMKVRGYLSLPDQSRASSRDLRIFVNDRVVRHPAIARSVQSAFESLVTQKRWPCGLLFIQVPSRMIDVNVHPQKTEIRLENEAILLEFITRKARESLLKYDQSSALVKEENPEPVLKGLTPWNDSETVSGTQEFEPTPASINNQAPLVSLSSVKATTPVKMETQTMKAPIAEISIDTGLMEPPGLRVVQESGGAKILSLSGKLETEPEKRFDFSQFELVGQLEETLIIGSYKEQMILIDQHVAQERILYERILKDLKKKGKLNRKKLLVPAVLKPSQAYLQLAQEHEERLAKLGFQISMEGESLLIHEYPDLMRLEMNEEFIERLLASFDGCFGSDHLDDYYKEVAESMACKGSIKAGDRLSDIEMERLVKDLSSCENPYQCPHGRPIVVKYPLKDVFRRFDRAYQPKKAPETRQGEKEDS